MIAKNKIKAYIKKSLYKIMPSTNLSYSQAGEDRILNFLFSDFGLHRFSYLDIGTNIPDFSNNSYLFYKKGMHGVCVEADVSLINHIKKIRPQDKIIHAGVSITEDIIADFYVFDTPAINTFDKVQADIRVSSGKYKIIRIDAVPLIKINSLIQENFDTFPEFLSLDIEGIDLAVLESLDYDKFPIPVICAETCQYSENHIRPKDNTIAEFLLKKGYEIYADTYINTIFVNKKWFYKKK